MALSAAAIAIGVTPASAAVTGVAGCDKDTFVGSVDWRGDWLAAGPVGFPRDRLAGMSRTRNRQFLAKRPLLVDSRDRSVTVSVPRRLRGRVFLYYGHWRDRDGEPTRAFRNARGFDSIIFTPCERRAPTVWPGGLRVKGRGPVHLRVEVGGRDHPLTLALGRPSAD